MDNETKGKLYDDYLRASDELQRINSKIKSQYTGNIPPDKQDEIYRNENKISVLVKKLESLF